MTWSVDSGGVGEVLKSTSGFFTDLSRCLYGSQAIGETEPVPGEVSVVSWEVELQDLLDSAGSDGLVAEAFASFLEDQSQEFTSVTNAVGLVFEVAVNATNALVAGDEQMAASVVAAARDGLNPVSGG